MADRRDLALAMLGAVEAAHFYSAFLPSIMTIKKFAGDESDYASIRQGEMTATGMTLLLGWILSEMTDSYTPFWFAAGMAVLMLTVYEQALRGTIQGGMAGAGGIAAATLIPGLPPPP